MKLSIFSIPARVIERFDPGLFVMIGILVTVLNDESGTDAIVTGLVALSIVIAVYVLLNVAIQLVRWRTYEITIEDETLAIRSGIVHTNRRTIPFSRIQHATLTQTPVSKLFGITAFECETAGNPDEPEVTVRYLDDEDATTLREWAPGTIDRSDDGDSSVVFSLSPRSLGLFALTRAHLRTTGLAVLTGLLVVVVSPGPVSGVRSTLVAVAETVIPVSSGLLVALVGLGGWVVGALLSSERLFGFTLSVDDDTFRRRHGLVRTFDADLSVDRIQVARVRSNPLHRVLGLAQADVGTAGLSGSLPFGLHWALAPLADDRVAWELVERTIGSPRPTLESIPTRARRRYFTRYALATVGLAVLTVIAQQFVPAARSIPLGVFVVAFVLTPLAAHVSWSRRGYQLTDETIVVRYGFWTQRTYVVPYDNVQNLTVSRTPFQRRADLATVRLDIASLPFLPGISLSDVDESVGEDIQRRLREEHVVEHGS